MVEVKASRYFFSLKLKGMRAGVIHEIRTFTLETTDGLLPSVAETWSNTTSSLCKILDQQASAA